MALTVHCRLIYAETAVRSQASNCEFSGGQSTSSTGTGFFFFRVLHFSTVSIIPPMLPHSSSSTRCRYQKDKRAKFGNVQKGNSLSEIGELWIQKEFSVVFNLSPQRTKNNACVTKQSYVTEDNKELARNK